MNCFNDFVGNVVRRDPDGIDDRGNAIRRVKRANKCDDLQFQIHGIAVMIAAAPAVYRLHGFPWAFDQSAQKPMIYAKSAGGGFFQNLSGSCFVKFVGIEKHNELL